MPKPELPPEFDEHCPMCGNEELRWGRFNAQNLEFLPDNQRMVVSVRYLAATECTRCSYLMLFNRKPSKK